MSKAKRTVSGRVLFTALMGGAAALVATGAGDAVAQGAPVDSEQQAQAGTAVAFDIPAQPLAQALTQFGRQSGLQVAVDAAARCGQVDERRVRHDERPKRVAAASGGDGRHLSFLLRRMQ